ncbi:MAG: DUF5678 domain-containing protein [Patescibacteria group bacterium]
MSNTLRRLPTIDIKKYGGKQIAIINGKIIASGKTLTAVLRRAKKSAPATPLHEIHIFSVPTSLTVIYHA